MLCEQDRLRRRSADPRAGRHHLPGGAESPGQLFPHPDRLHRVHAGEPGERGEVWRRLGEQPGNLCLQRPVHAGGHEEGRELHPRQEPELLQCRRSADRHRQLCVPQRAGDGEDGV